MKSCLGRSTPSLKPFFDCRGRECFAELACSRADTSTPGVQSWVSSHSKKADSPQHSGSYACRSPQDTDCLKEHQFLFLTSGKKLLHSCQQEMLQVCILTIHQSVKTGNIQLGTAPVHAAVLILRHTIISCMLSRGFCMSLTVLEATLGNHGHGLMHKADMLHAGFMFAVDALPISCCCRPVGGDQVPWANQSLAGPWVTPTR